MEFTFSEYVKIRKPCREVFDAVYNPKKLSSYFTTGGASGPLEGGATVEWDFADFPGKFPVSVRESIPEERIVIEWANSEGGTTHVEFLFEVLDAASTKVSVREWGWKRIEPRSLEESYSHCMGWMQMLCSLKVYLEHGINIREFFF